MHRSVRIFAVHRLVYEPDSLQGTLPFISYRVLPAWEMGESVLHTAIDDLESFAWVMLWAALHTPAVKTLKENLWLQALSSDNISMVAMRKHVIMMEDLDPQKVSGPLRTLWPLLTGWFAIARAGRTALNSFLQRFTLSTIDELRPTVPDDDVARTPDDFCSELEGVCLPYYKLYLEKAVEFLGTM